MHYHLSNNEVNIEINNDKINEMIEISKIDSTCFSICYFFIIVILLINFFLLRNERNE